MSKISNQCIASILLTLAFYFTKTRHKKKVSITAPLNIYLGSKVKALFSTVLAAARFSRPAMASLNLTAEAV